MRDSLLIILSKYMNSTTITLNEFIHMCERKGRNPGSGRGLNVFVALFAFIYFYVIVSMYNTC